MTRSAPPRPGATVSAWSWRRTGASPSGASGRPGRGCHSKLTHLALSLFEKPSLRQDCRRRLMDDPVTLLAALLDTAAGPGPAGAGTVRIALGWVVPIRIVPVAVTV
jgi:hypothetical protein